jgi:hypothetical protein
MASSAIVGKRFSAMTLDLANNYASVLKYPRSLYIFKKKSKVKKAKRLRVPCRRDRQKIISVPVVRSRKNIDSCRLAVGKVYTPNPNGSSGNAIRRLCGN